MQTLHRPHDGLDVATGSTRHRASAWILDVEGFHAEFGRLFDALSGPDGPSPLRRRASELWRSDDPTVRRFVERVETNTPEEWEAEFDQAHLGQWYRLLMAAHVEPTRAVRAPDLVRRRLPELGVSPAYARRLAAGRELTELAAAHAPPAVAATMELVMGAGTRGWLSHDDVGFALDSLRQLDPRAFRRAQDLVPICEDLWQSLAEAATDEATVLVLVPPRR